MDNEITIKDALNIWAAENKTDTPHLTRSQLFACSLPDGLKDADEELVDHLSLCPECLETWKMFSDINTAPAADEYETRIVAFGMSKAAAPKDIDRTKPREFTSEEHDFRLTILPDPENPDTATLAVDVKNSEDIEKYQNKTILLRDKNNTIFFSQTLRRGRAAQESDMIDDLDLSIWSVSISEPA